MKTLLETTRKSARIGVSRHSLSTLQIQPHPAINQCYFTKLPYLKSFGCDEVIIVSYKSIEADDFTLVFIDRQTHLICCNRLKSLSGIDINLICEKLFLAAGARFIKFEDIELRDQRQIIFPNLHLTHQENWRRELSGASPYLSNKQASNLRRKMRRLRESFGIHDAKLQKLFGMGDVGFEFRLCTPKDIDEVVALNAKTLGNQGRTHQYDPINRKILNSICSKHGYFAGLFVDELMIAGNIITVIGNQAYFNLTGYDQEFARYSPGLQVHASALIECEKLRCTTANFLWGNSRWKSDIGGSRVPLTTLFICRDQRDFLEGQLWSEFLPLIKVKGRKVAKRMLTKIGFRPNVSTKFAPIEYNKDWWVDDFFLG